MKSKRKLFLFYLRKIANFDSFKMQSRSQYIACVLCRQRITMLPWDQFSHFVWTIKFLLQAKRCIWLSLIPTRPTTTSSSSLCNSPPIRFVIPFRSHFWPIYYTFQYLISTLAENNVSVFDVKVSIVQIGTFYFPHSDSVIENENEATQNKRKE